MKNNTGTKLYDAPEMEVIRIMGHVALMTTSPDLNEAGFENIEDNGNPFNW